MSQVTVQSVLIVNLKSLPTWHLDLADGFAALGIDARTFITTPQTLNERIAKSARGTKWFRSAPVLHRLVDACRTARPDLIIFLGMFVLPRTMVESLTRGLGYKPVLCGWVCDCFREPQFADWIPADHVFYFDTFLADILPRFYADRSVTTYLPLAANPARYRPLAQRTRREELLFVGTVSGNRRALLDTLAGRVPLAVYGPGSGRSRFRRRRKLDSVAINALYNAHRAVLNINQTPNTEHGLNLRTFEVAAAGGVLLTEDCPDLRQLYEPGRELLSFTGVEDVVQRYQEALAEPERAAVIAAAGRRRTLAEHTFVHRARTIVDTLR